MHRFDMDDAHDIVVSEAWRAARRLPSHLSDIDELRQDGWIGLLQAAHRYDDSFTLPWHGWARIRVRGAIIDAVRRRAPGSRSARGPVTYVPLDAPDADERSWAVDLTDPADVVADGDYARWAAEVVHGGLLDVLTGKQRGVIIHHDIEGRTQQSLADRDGVTAVAVSLRRAKALRKMAEALT